MKKIAASVAALALIAGTSVASAASMERVGASVGESEGVAPTLLIVAAFAAVATGVVIVTEGGDNDEPTSP